MPLRTIKTAIIGLLGLQQFGMGFQPNGIGGPTLTPDETAIVEAVNSVVAAIVGPPGAQANFTYTVANLAARPAINTVPDGTLVYVETQKSWYWSDLPANTYRRMIQPNQAWMTQATWRIDPATGSDENVGDPSAPLASETELFARLPAINQSVTVQIAAAAALGRFLWQPVIERSAAGVTLTIAGTRTLGADHATVSSSDETATQTPRIDAGFAITIGSILQATSGAASGATAVVVALVAGTNYATTPWRNAAGARVAPPSAADNVAVVALPTTTFWSVAIQGATNSLAVSNMSIASIDDPYVQFGTFNTCFFASAFFLSIGFYSFRGCSFRQAADSILVGANSPFFGLCGFSGTGFFAWDGTTFGGMNDCAIAGGMGLVCRDNAYLTVNSLGIIGAAVDALTSVRGSYIRVGGTLYGSGNALRGTVVSQGGSMGVVTAVTPTLASTGQELIVDEAVTSLPTVTTAAAATVNWANWVTNGRNAIGNKTVARVMNT